MIIIIATIKSTPRAAVKMIHNALSEKNPRLELGARLVGESDEIKKKKKSIFLINLVFLLLLFHSLAASCVLYNRKSTLEAPLFVE